jgi:dolichol-phosphate mannosyltransferase
LIEAFPKTGRMHQIRKHLDHLRHPIIGDRPWGCNKQNKLFLEKWELNNMMLHADSINIIHPFSNEKLFINANQPEEFLRIQKETSADVVYGIRNSRREDNFFKKFTASIYYFLMKKLSGINIRANAADYRLIVKEVRDVLISLDEQDKIFRLLIPSLNFKEAELSFVAEKRKYGKSKYGIRDMGLLAISSVLSFSIKPLRWAIWIGLWAVLISVLWIIFIFVAQISGWVIQGWTSLIAAVVLFAGVKLLILGIVGQYIGQIYVNQQRRPKYLFKNK